MNGRQGLMDRLRGRVIFPISEATGRDVVAFGGRLVPGVELRTAPRDGDPPKYMNSPESEVYRKSRTLYGLNWARAEVQRRETALVVEGYMDVIGLHLAGVRNAVAPCGTALTAEHLALLERHTPRVVLALDADQPGYAAAERARALAAEVGIREVGVLPLPPGQDPADLAGSGEGAVERALAGVVTAVEFQLTHLLRTADLGSPEAQSDAYRRTFPLLTGIGDRFLRYRYLRDVVAPAVRLNADLLEQELDRAMAAGGRGPAAGAAVPARDARTATLPGELGDAARDPQPRMEGWVLQAALQRPDLLPPMWADVEVEDFRAPAARQLFTALRSAPAGDLEAVLDALPDDRSRSGARALLMADLSVEPDEAHVASLLAGLRAASVGRRLEEVRDELSRVNAQVDGARQRELSRLYLELEGRRRDLVEGRTA
jgi:DNA primase